MTRAKSKLTGRLFDAANDDQEIEVGAGMALPKKNQLLWIESGRASTDLERVDAALGWADVLSHLTEPGSRPKIALTKEFVRIRVVGMEKHQADPKPVVLDLVAAPNIVVTVHDDPIEGLDLPLDVQEGETTFGALDAPAFTAMLLDGMLTGYFQAVENVEREIDELDERALRSSRPEDMLAELVALRRQIAILRRALSPQREVFYSLERPGLVLGDSVETSWPLVGDRFRQAMEAVENARELLVGSFDIAMTKAGQRTNDIMRVLTVISSVLLPAVVVAGVMGMNFKAGIFDAPENFFVVIAAMAALAGAILVFARIRRWI
ncbi:MAG: CorA family divalent cation transporter [Candidatus Limnocylindrales bacterium]